MKQDKHIQLTQALFVEKEELKQQKNLLEKERVELASRNVYLEEMNQNLKKSLETFKKIAKKLIKAIVPKSVFEKKFTKIEDDDPLNSLVKSGDAEDELIAALKISSKVNTPSYHTWFDSLMNKLEPTPEKVEKPVEEIKKAIKLHTDL